MEYNRQAHELVDETLQKMIRVYGANTAYAKMTGYLMVNVSLETAERIARLEEEKAGK